MTGLHQKYGDDERPSRISRHHKDRDSYSRSPPRRRPRSASSSPRSYGRSNDKYRRDYSPNPTRRRRSRSQDRRSRSPRREVVSRSSRIVDHNVAPQNPDSSMEAPTVEKQRPNFGVSGKLAAETNTVLGTDITLKYNEPPEARKVPASQAWRLYVFKGSDTLAELELHLRSCWLFGHERVIADHHVEHPSVSKQHAVIQFRYIEKRNEYGDRIGAVKPYILDLDSSNGTRVNGKKVPPSRYYELRSGDVVLFGDSQREYVMMLPPKI